MKIEKNVPHPNSNHHQYGSYPFKDMDIGDSVFYEGDVKLNFSKEYLAAQHHGRNNGKKFSGRAQDGGVRIWRIS